MIKFEHVSKTYPNGVKGLQDINLEIEDGEFVGIIGMSGAGKSTFIRTINRLNNITEGKLTVDGVEISNLKGKALRRFRRKVGMIFQSYNLVPRITVIRNVMSSLVPDMPLWRVILGLFSKNDKMRALEALDRVSMLDKAFVRTDQLSGGQQQRVSLARTLAQNPSVLLADEPVAALDPVTAHEVMDDFKRINDELGQTVLINIHHVDLALDYAKRIIGIRSGRVVYDGPVSGVTQEILDNIYSKDEAE
ncbi:MULTISPECIES: phosphonate ABC transporter ATP-binding protein [Leuconostoc]|jgi:phosphonate transport system ATP-binding protein|uniref:Phosphonate ABC transporter ATP-binding protein n=2 Tax=Leuconostoc pseudomesenteroides TaxID=33968 RepID=A0A5B8T1D7_LEUPS|nr:MULTISPECIES: phosphonate ABC transporter ATP-binding protein [Leuconostoc]MBK0040335.1 phosphonate ABC transporter ATP-binding protein [Leuconostoc sp. S51]MBK0051241.1 phosphonate ABC transporter ATP-binding protein [Leuconostoc sp. S50]MBS0958561.1 phosphonate ABC transporter ATP-binding protein [Leuconostoc pseudomesenteroides]MCC7669010.1 phosphonate ABC transporter ATP-binding protein [Leuconostoc pseudomesenteroides]MCC8440488.1 phosphonate ABC transporter ATP-binding protein [Leucon